MKKFLLLLIIFIYAPIFSLPILKNGKIPIAVIGDEKSEITTKMEVLLSKVSFIELVEKKKQKVLLKELSLDQTGIYNPKTSKKLGKLSGAVYFIIFYKTGSAFRLVDIETGSIKGAWEEYSEKNVNDMLTILETEVALIELINTTPPESKKQNITINNLKCTNADNEQNAKIESDSLESDLWNINDSTITCNFKIGQEISIEYGSHRKDKVKTAYLTVLVYTSDGNIIQVFPNKYEENNEVSVNELYTFPASNAKFSFQAAEPEGVDKMVIILSDKPVGLPGNSPRAGIFLYSNTQNQSKTKGVTVSLQKLGKNNYDIKHIFLKITR